MTHNDPEYIVVHRGRVLCLGGELTRHPGCRLAEVGLSQEKLSHQAQLLDQSGVDTLFMLPLLEPDEELEALVENSQSPWHWADLREFLAQHNQTDFHNHARAVQYFHWLREHRFCGVCGGKTLMSTSENALQCQQCAKHWFPRIQPCIITLIHRGDEILLAKHARYITNMYSCIAGFVESGESLEQTLHREVREEVGLQVHNLRYFGSQAWPFPYQLMVGYYAEYLSGDIDIDPVEIADARWWSIDDLPNRPPTSSISGQLIDRYVANYLNQSPAS